MLLLLALGIVLWVGRLVLAILLGWLVSWRRPSWALVGGVVNTIILSAAALSIEQFRRFGLGVWSVGFTVLAIWFAAHAAELGTVAIKTIRRKI